MALLHPQLEAFLAVIEEGGFERAAGRLCITPSALSQRIKGLEDRLGAVLVRRSVPAVVTPAGEKLLRRAQSMRLLESETLADFRPGEETDRVARITILVNNDSLATWLPEALTDFALHAGSSEKGRQRVALDVRTDDQDHALESLRNGTAVAVVTSESAPVPGARATALGAMRYVAVASPDFAETFLRGDPNETLRNAPVLCFDRKDSLQERFLAGLGIGPVERPGVVHYAPSPAAMIELTVRGLGWSMAPDLLAQSLIRTGELVEFVPGRTIDVPLFWQCSAIRSALLMRLGDVIRKTAAKRLRPIVQ